jgi:hypothetical protein
MYHRPGQLPILLWLNLFHETERQIGDLGVAAAPRLHLNFISANREE